MERGGVFFAHVSATRQKEKAWAVLVRQRLTARAVQKTISRLRFGHLSSCFRVWRTGANQGKICMVVVDLRWGERRLASLKEHCSILGILSIYGNNH